VLIGEPPQSQGDLHFALFGIPVRVHPFFWLVAVLLGLGGAGQQDMRAALGHLLVWVAAVFVAILVHELGHALVMRRWGFQPWITLYGLGGLASYNPGGIYGRRGPGTWGNVLISAAGPGAGFLLALAIVGLLHVTGQPYTAYRWGIVPIVIPGDVFGLPVVGEWIADVLFVCILWGIVNLLPVYPLDGGHISRELFLASSPRQGIQHSLILSIATGAMVAVFALARLQDFFLAFFFGYMAFSSYMVLQAYRGGGR